MNHHRVLSFAVFCLLATAAPRLARSQPPTLASDASSAQADDLTHRGVDLLKQHQWAEAEALFRQALALKRSYDIVGNLGLAEAGLGKWRDATEHIAFALSTFPANGKPAHRDLLREKLAAAREHVGGMTIEVDVAGSEVLVDSKSVGTAPLAGEVFVEPGAHVVEARLAGREGARREVTVAAGGSADVKLMLPETRVPPATPPWRPGPALLIPAGALAAVGVALGAGFTVAANGKASDASALDATLGTGSSLCVTPAVNATSNCAKLHDAVAGKGTFSNAALTSFVGGGAFALVTVGLGVWATAAPKTAPFRVAPVMGAGTGGVLIEGTW